VRVRSERLVVSSVSRQRSAEHGAEPLDERKVSTESLCDLGQCRARRANDSAFDAADLRLRERGLLSQLDLCEVMLLAQFDYLASDPVCLI
jgi:hypothetical protein